MKRVLVGGCFDLIHYGHIVFLKEARKQGDYLIVALESDDNVKKYKGENRPVHKQSERAEMLRSLRMVDEVIELPPMNSDKEYFDLVKHVLPNVIAITKDDPQTENKKKQASLINAQTVEVTHLVRPYSTTLLINEL